MYAYEKIKEEVETKDRLREEINKIKNNIL